LQTFPQKDALQIDKGELIAYSGNTGGSFGPHLHFELREEQSQHPVNPLLHGIEVEDQIRPQLRKLFVFNKRDNDSLSVAEEISLNKVNDSLYVTRLIQGAGSLGFGLQLFDRQDRSWNKNGVYALRMRINGQTVFGYRFDAFSFQDSKGISQLIDYKTYVDQGTRVQKLFDPLFEDLSFIEQESDGFVNIEPGKSYQLLIEVEDFAGNTSYIETYIEGTTP
ncbi:MAG: M23 family metallopeptidase, partial [Flavobacteriaceae bacterium]